MEEQQDREPEIQESEVEPAKEPARAEEPEPARGAEELENAEMMERLQEEIRNLSVGDHLVFMMQSLSSLAVARMGLAPDTAAGRDMEQARLAIDAFKALLELLEKAKPVGEVAVHRGMLSQLQLEYVGALGARDKGGHEAAGGDEAAQGEEAAEGGEAAGGGEAVGGDEASGGGESA